MLFMISPCLSLKYKVDFKYIIKIINNYTSILTYYRIFNIKNNTFLKNVLFCNLIYIVIYFLSIIEINKNVMRHTSHSINITWGNILNEGTISHINKTIIPAKVV